MSMPVPFLPPDLDAQPTDLAEQLLHSEQVLHGHFLRAWRDTVKLPNGQQAGREYVRHPGAVVIVASLPDGRYLIEYQYRHPVGRAMLEFPAGKIDAGEPSLASAQRELREETGYAPAVVNAETVHYCGAVWDNPGMGTSISHIYRVRGLQLAGATQPDHGEMVTLHWVTPHWLKQAVASGEIRDRVVVAAVAYLLLAGEL